MTTLWVGVIVITLIVEVITTALVSVWFIIGAAAALIANLMGASNYIQYGVFVIMSLLSLIACRPILIKNRKISNDSSTLSNVKQNIGKDAIITETIDNVVGTGRVNLGGNYWAARSVDDTVITDGIVTVVRVEGAKVIVKAKEKEEEEEAVED